MKPLVLLAVPLLLVAGCVTPDPEPAVTPAPPTDDVTNDETAPGEELVVAGPEVFHCQATAEVGAQVGGVGAINNMPCRLSDATQQNLTEYPAALIEVAWESFGATVQNVEVIIESDSCASTLGSGCTHGRTEGSRPPLRIELGEEALGTYGNDNMAVYARPEPVASGEVFDVYVSLFNSTVPSGYTAVPVE